MITLIGFALLLVLVFVLVVRYQKQQEVIDAEYAGTTYGACEVCGRVSELVFGECGDCCH